MRPGQEEEEQRIQEREQQRAQMHRAQAEARGGAGPIKIRDAPVPRAAARGKAAQQTTICPNCNQQVPYTELQEHMRIELLDPRWKEQKAKAESRYAMTNLSTADVANNLKRLASQRSDVFDAAGMPVSEEEAARRKRIAVNAFDGNPEGKPGAHANHLQAVNVEEQIRAIHQKFAGEKR